MSVKTLRPMPGTSTYLQPKVISHPATTAQQKQLPLVPSHTHVCYRTVDDFGFAYAYESQLKQGCSNLAISSTRRTYDHRQSAGLPQPSLLQHVGEAAQV